MFPDSERWPEYILSRQNTENNGTGVFEIKGETLVHSLSTQLVRRCFSQSYHLCGRQKKSHAFAADRELLRSTAATFSVPLVRAETRCYRFVTDLKRHLQNI